MKRLLAYLFIVLGLGLVVNGFALADLTFVSWGGAFWFDSKINYAGERIELISNGNTCRDITGFYEWLQKAMEKQGLQEFCVFE